MTDVITAILTKFSTLKSFDYNRKIYKD